MRVVWHVVPIGNGRFRLKDHFGEEIAIVDRKRDVFASALDYVRRNYRRNAIDDIVFEGLELIPFFPTRWLHKSKERVFGGIRRLVSR